MRNAINQISEDPPLDILVIGGGIVGSGIARDAAMRGLRVGLVEQHDFASGTSSRSSRLLHGGLRYLAQGRIGLVRQASIEKKLLHEIAPHLAEPRAFIFPTYRANRHWVLWQLKIGVKLYDLLCGGRNLGQSSWLSSAQVVDKVPALNPAGLTGGVRYFDAFTNDARLVLDTLRSAARNGACLLNYCRFKNASRKELWHCEVQDQLGNQTFPVRARAVVNATGPWAQEVPHSQVKLRITKGCHLVVEHSRLPVPDAVVLSDDKRILFAIPWGQRTIIGTTDTDFDGSLDKVSAEVSDVSYLLTIANRFFPSAGLRKSDVVSVWAGLRPLLADPNGQPSDISRSHHIGNPEPGWWDVAGGKLTTYRLMAEETVDQIIKWLKQLNRLTGLNAGYAECRTAKEPLLPATEVAGLSSILPPELSQATVEHYVKSEWAVHLDDVMLRRTGWHYYYADAGKMAKQVADWMGELMRWSADVRAGELERYLSTTGPQAYRTMPQNGSSASEAVQGPTAYGR